GEVGRRRVLQEILVFGNPPPVAVVAEEQTRLALGGVALGVDAGLRHVARDAVAQRGDPLRPEHPAQRHRAVAPERIDRRRIQCRAVPDRHLVSPLAVPGRTLAVVAGSVTCSTTCSIAPNTLAPSPSTTSILIRSPKLMNGVDGLPCAMVSIMRISAMQE